MTLSTKAVQCSFIFYIVALGVVSAAISVLAAWLLIDVLSYAPLLSSDATCGPIVALVVVGVLALPLFVLLAWRAFAKRCHALAVTFWVSVCVCGVACAMLGIWCIVARARLHDHLGVHLDESTPPQQRSPIERAQWDYVQRKLGCCGVHGAADYQGSGAIPLSCCDQLDHTCATVHSQGCLVALADFGGGRLSIVAITSAALFIFLILGVYAGICFSGYLKRKMSEAKSDTPETLPLAETKHRSIFLGRTSAAS